MDLSTTTKLGNELLSKTFTVNQVRLSAKELGYSLSFNNNKSRLGYCDYTDKKISLSKPFVLANSIELVTDTILHELSHAFSFHLFGRKGTGHNHFWKNVCVQVGAIPKRAWKTETVGLVAPAHSYELRHKTTKVVYGKYFRKSTRISSGCTRGTIWVMGKKTETKGNLEFVAVC